MRCPRGVAATLVVSLAAVPVLAEPDPPQRSRRALLVNLSPFAQAAVRRALDFALAKLASSECPQVYSDFALEGGGTPQDELDRRGIVPAEVLETLVFLEGSREPVCRLGRAALTTKPGSRVIWVCPSFTELHLRHPALSASLIIHESLHALGLGEDPPRSSEITRAVERRCWRRGHALAAPR